MEEDLFYHMILQAETYQLQKVLNSNTVTEKFGLHLSEDEARQLLVGRKTSLREQERLELGEGILPKLIFTFCDSPHIYQDNFVDTIGALQDLFYLYKSESLEELTDDELIAYMKEHFDGECEGSLEFLEENCLDDFCRTIRKGNNIFISQEEEDEY